MGPFLEASSMNLTREIFSSFIARGIFLAQAEAEAPALTPFQQFLSSPFLLLGGLLALFYVVVLLPERRRKVEEANKQAAIKKNDRIVTIGGIHGVVASASDPETLLIRIDESGNTKMKIDRRAVARVLTDTSEAPPAANE